MDILEKVMKRAWKIVTEIDEIPNTPNNRRLLATCVVDEASTGELDYTKLLEGALTRFRQQQAKL
jgi:hypothetical protein